MLSGRLGVMLVTPLLPSSPGDARLIPQALKACHLTEDTASCVSIDFKHLHSHGYPFGSKLIWTSSTSLQPFGHGSERSET